MNSSIDRLPPQNLEAEKSVIGCLLLDPMLCDDVLPILKAEDFYNEANSRLFAQMAAMHNEGRRIDTTLLIDRLKAAGEFEKIGGSSYLNECALVVAVAQHAAYYAKIVSENARRRNVIYAATNMLATAYDSARPIDEVVAECEAALQRIPTGEYEGNPVSFDQALIEAFALVDEITQRKQAAGLMTGLENFDQHAGGLFGGELVVLAARPSIGKTALALQIAQHVAASGRHVYFASLEMRFKELALRVLCGHSRVAMSRVRASAIGPADLIDMTDAGVELSGLPIALHDRAGLTVQDIRRACRRLAAKGKLDLVVVDYLQRVTPADRRVDRHLQVGQITWDLKALALELQVPVLCLSQLGRAAEERDKKTGLIAEPRLSHLKESGDIEQDADMVLLLHRQPRAADAVMILAKNRQGEQSRFKLFWEAERTRFSVLGCGGF